MNILTTLTFMIYVIDKYDICPDTGFIDVTARYKIFASEGIERHHYKSHEDAYSNICFQMKHAVYDRYRNYIKNTRVLYDSGNVVYRSIIKSETFTYLFNTLTTLWDRDLNLMCKNIIALREQLHKILPGAKHPEHYFFHDELLEIVAFAKSHKDFSLETLKQRETTST